MDLCINTDTNEHNYSNSKPYIHSHKHANSYSNTFPYISPYYFLLLGTSGKCWACTKHVC